MNKTLTVNIAGLVFHIEELAYQNLHQYLEAIKNSITAEGRDEVIHDIEIRIAELFSSKIDDYNQVITTTDVEEVIQIMGTPEDYKIDSEQDDTDENYYSFPKVRKLYRDKEKALLGGVLAGFGHYFKIDVVWLRILFLILLLLYGAGIFFYLILWIVVPAARTTSQILEMRGEPINISSIERKVKENVDYVTDKFKKMDYDKFSQKTHETANQTLDIIKRFLGVILLIISTLGFILASFLALFIAKNIHHGIPDRITEILYTDTYPMWVTISIIIFLMLTPFLVILLIGLKLLYSNMKHLGKILLSLVCLWIIAIFALAIPIADVGKVREVKQKFIEFGNYRIQKEVSLGSASDTLKLDFKPLSFFTSGETTDTLSSQTYGAIDLDIDFKHTFQDNPYATIELKTEGREIIKNLGIDNLVNIPTYQSLYKDGTLYLSDRIVYDNQTANDETDVKITIFIPTDGTILINSIHSSYFNDSHPIESGTHVYKLINGELSCIDCIQK